MLACMDRNVGRQRWRQEYAPNTVQAHLEVTPPARRVQDGLSMQEINERCQTRGIHARPRVVTSDQRKLRADSPGRSARRSARLLGYPPSQQLKLFKTSTGTRSEQPSGDLGDLDIFQELLYFTGHDDCGESTLRCLCVPISQLTVNAAHFHHLREQGAPRPQPDRCPFPHQRPWRRCRHITAKGGLPRPCRPGEGP